MPYSETLRASEPRGAPPKRDAVHLMADDAVIVDRRAEAVCGIQASKFGVPEYVTCPACRRRWRL